MIKTDHNDNRSALNYMRWMNILTYMGLKQDSVGEDREMTDFQGHS